MIPNVSRQIRFFGYTARVPFALGVLLSIPVAAMPARSQTSPAANSTAPLIVQNREIVVFRAFLGASSPQDRARAAARRIESALDAGAEHALTDRSIPEGVLILAGDRPLFSITPGDLDTAAGETLSEVGERVRLRLAEALRAEVEQRSLPNLLWAISLTIIATLLLVVSLYLIAAGRRFLRTHLEAKALPRLPSLTIRGFTLIETERIVDLLRKVPAALAWGAGLVAVYLWLVYSLTRFPYSEPWGEALGSYLLATVTTLALGILKALPGLFTVALVLIVARFLARLVTALFSEVEQGNLSLPWLHAETAQPTRRIFIALIWLFAVVVAYPYLPGSGSEALKGIGFLVGLMLSLGSTGLVNQAMSGLVVMYARALKPEEYVRIVGTEGTVQSVGLLSTKIMTNKRELVTIPNAVLVGQLMLNLSRAGDPGVIIYTSVTIGYDAPWRQVHALLQHAAERTPGLRTNPPPFVRQRALADFYVEYELNAHLERPQDRVQILSLLHSNIQDAFNEAGVQIMSPHYEADPSRPKVVPTEKWHEAAARRTES